jgi:membrane protein
VPSVAENLSKHLAEILQNFKALSIFSLVFLLTTCVFLLYAASSSFDAIWRTSGLKRWWWTLIIYFFLILLTPIFIGVILISTAWLVSLSFIHNLWFIERFFFLTAPYVLLFLLFTFLNWILPTCHVRWREAACGGLLTTVLFELAKNIFVIYLRLFPTYRILYGAFAIIPIFLIWLYIAWMIILLGGMVSYAASQKFQLDKIR